MVGEASRREEVPQAEKWRIETLYSSDTTWETAFESARQLPATVASYQGRLSESDTVLSSALASWFEAQREAERVWVYAHLRNDEDLGNGYYQNMMERSRSAYVRLSTAGSYLAPEILAIDDITMARWMEGKALAPYRVWLEDLLRRKPHTLSPAEERLMSMVSEPLTSLQKIFGVLKNVDLAARLPSIVDDEGTERKLSHALFVKLLESRDRTVRKKAFSAYYAEYGANRHTIAATLDGMVKAHVFESQARGFGSALEAALFNDNVDVAVYDALISTVQAALPAFYRYVSLRKRLLRLDRLHLYDMYVPTVPQIDLRYSYDEAVDLVGESMKPLGTGYVRTMRQGLARGWVDRYENPGKRSGAYSSGCYDSMPFILLNYTGTLDAVFTLAHEVGHSMHSLYSNQRQPYHLADYRILVGEVASTTNESLLHHHLLSTIEDRATRAYLVGAYLDNYRATLFRQTMFAEFERTIHSQVEEGQALTADFLDSIYYDLVKRYFGSDVAFDEEDEMIAWEWSRIDHFFYDFYVYKYATGMASAIAMASMILSADGGRDRYLAFLGSGSSKYPLDLLRDAGVDLTTPQPVEAALTEFQCLVDEMEHLMS